MTQYSILKVNQIVFMSKDTKKSAEFYGQILGLQHTDSYDSMVFFKVGETTLMLHPSETTVNTENGLGIEFRVDDLNALVERVRKSEIGKIVQEPIDREWGVRETIIEDPDGYQIWFTQDISNK